MYATTPAWLQPKLAVNAPADIYEQEADRVAEQVLHMPQPPARSFGPAFGPVRGPAGGQPLTNPITYLPEPQVQRQPGAGGPAATAEPTDSQALPRIDVLRPSDQRIAEGIFQTIAPPMAGIGSVLIMTPGDTTRITQDEQINATLDWKNPARGLFRRREQGAEAAAYTIHWEVPDPRAPELELRNGAVVAQDSHIYSMAVMPGIVALNAAEAQGFNRDAADWRFALSFRSATSYDSPAGSANLAPWGFQLLVEQTVSKTGDVSRVAQLAYSGVTSVSPMVELPPLDFSPDAEP